MTENTMHQINNPNFYYKYAAKYSTATADMKAEARAHWTKCHTENILSGRNDLIIFSAQILAAMDTADAITEGGTNGRSRRKSTIDHGNGAGYNIITVSAQERRKGEKMNMRNTNIKEKARRNGGTYDTKKYRYDIDTQTGKLRRVELDKLDTTEMLRPDAWETLE